MSTMVDPFAGLVSYQEALSKGLIQPGAAIIHKELSVLLDDADGDQRLTYACTTDGIVKAIAVYVMNGVSGGTPYFQVGYAVAEKYRGQGIAKKLLKMSIEEMAVGFRNHFPSFYIEAVVSIDNLASIKVAEQVIGGQAEKIVDKFSGESALRYTMHIERAIGMALA